MLVFNLEEKEVFLYEKLKLAPTITNTQGLMLHMPSSLDEVKRLCDHAIWLDKGEMKMIGQADAVCDAYLEEQKRKITDK